MRGPGLETRPLNEERREIMSSVRVRRGRALGAAGVVLILAGSAGALPIKGRLYINQVSARPGGTVDPHLDEDLQFMDAVYSQIGIRAVRAGAPAIVGRANYDDRATAVPPRQITGAAGLLTQSRGGANNSYIYYVQAFNSSDGGSPPGQAWSDEDVRGGITNAAGVVVPPRGVGSNRRPDTTPHELGHLLTDRWRWRAFEGGGVHSTNPVDIMTPSDTRNIAANAGEVWPRGNKDQIRHNIGAIGNAGTVRQPLINAIYDNSGGGGPNPPLTLNTNLVSETQRDGFQYSMNQNNSTIVQNANWGEASNITLPVFAGGTHTYTLEETARRGQNSTESYSFFITSTGGFSLGGDLGNGFSFSAFGINTLDGEFTNFVANSVEIRAWNDILFAGPHTDANGGAGVLIDPSNYTAFGNISAGALNFDLNFPTANASVLAGYRDVQITLNVGWIPAPGAAGLLALAGLLAGRRRRR
jgi:hypothetical protein